MNTGQSDTFRTRGPKGTFRSK